MSEEKDNEIENVRVVVRVRPLNKREKDTDCQIVTHVDHEHNQITVKKSDAAIDASKSYTFDALLPEDCSQTDVYCQTTRPVVDKVLQGYNGTILAYGQTGTGKTYTMTGSGGRDQRGIIPNTFAHIFSHVGNAKEELTFLVHVTYLEIYNENVRDLLLAKSNKSHTHPNLEVREHSEFGVFVENLSGYIVNTLEELERLMDIGDKNRAVGATDLNDTSSRSHTIFTITIESNDKRVEGGKFTRGKLHLVDLAGSERQSKTHASGIRLKEATKINQSLSVLGNVISALVDGKSNHIPYRNSKLTRLLQDSLGGNSKTVMITTISPSESDYEETVSTLRYANRAKNIQNHTHMNEQPKDTLLRSFQTEIEELRKQLDNTTVDIAVSPEPDPDTPSKKKDRTKKPCKKKTSPNDQPEVDSPQEILDEEANEEIVKARQENKKLREKLQQIEEKILVGGESLLEKAQHQEFLLQVAQSNIDDSIKRQEELKQYLRQCEEERILIEERYSTTQEEVASKTKKLKKLGTLISNAKTELVDLQQEQQREMEVILDTVRGMTRELQLAELIINAYIPVQYQSMIEKHIRWNEDVGEYHLKCVAYTGNNMRKRLNAQMSLEHESPVHHMPYLQYANTNRKSRRQSNVPRPARVH